MQPIPTYQELVEEAENTVRNICGITNFTESSVAGSLIKVFCSYLTDLYGYAQSIYDQSNLSTATGENLDKIGEFFGVKRLPAKAATSIGMGSSVQFRNNSASPVTIPALTRIWSPADPSISYATNTSLTLAAGADGYVDVTALGTGFWYNVGSGTLTRHDLGNANVTVTNVLPIINGAAVESDDNYRYRIANAFTVMQGATSEAIRIRLLELPGIKEAYLYPMARGTGTIDVIITSVETTVSQTLLNEAQDILDKAVAFGISAIAKAPTEIPIDLVVKLSLDPAATASNIRILVTAAAKTYVDNLQVGDSTGRGALIFYELVSRIMDASEYIRNAQLTINVNGQPSLNTDQIANIGEKFYLRSIEVI